MKEFIVVVLIGFVFLVGSALISETAEADDNVATVIFAQIGSSPTSLVVDRGDDPDGEFPCSDAPNDCSLRSAITIANQDGILTTIAFADHYRIVLNRPLPPLTEIGTTIRAHSGQEVHIDGAGIPGRIFEIADADITIEGLRLYGAGTGQAHIMVSQGAQRVVIANNVIGDDDAPAGNCGQGDASYGGIYVGGEMEIEAAVRVWIYGNIIECLTGIPGNGITVTTDKVVIGRNKAGSESGGERNVIRNNRGYGIDLGFTHGNTICNNFIHDNLVGGLAVANYNNDIMSNDIQ